MLKREHTPDPKIILLSTGETILPEQEMLNQGCCVVKKDHVQSECERKLSSEMRIS